MRERIIERYLVKRVKEIGGVCKKNPPTYESGWPDRVVYIGGFTFFVELKRPGETPSKLQAIVLQDLRRLGFDARHIDSKEGIDAFIEYVKKIISINSI